MKKHALIAIVLIASNVSVVLGQCSPDMNCPFDSLICTSSNAQACEGIAYATVLTLAVPSSYTDPGSGTAYTILNARITGIAGLPSGISYQCDTVNCTINGGDRGCILISETSNTPGVYPTNTFITVTIDYCTPFGCIPFGVNDTISGSFVVQAKDCAGVCGGSATIDNCSICSGGTTGILPDCDDGDPCTQDACNGQGSCLHTPICNVTISGKIQTETGIAVPGVTVQLTGSDTQNVVTAGDGLYSFAVAAGGSYVVTPSKSNDSTTNNGITTLDITLMRRHVLGSAFLNSPYKVIAADANNSGTVSTGDIPVERVVVLSNTTKFPPLNSRLWEFVNSDQTFSLPPPDNPYNPFPFTKTRNYSNVTSNQINQNFIAVKVGDVNNSWDPDFP